jgi:hypothetical protein
MAVGLLQTRLIIPPARIGLVERPRLLERLNQGLAAQVHPLSSLTDRRSRLPGGQTQTILTGPLPDQAALRGILNMLWDLNLELVSLKRMGR